MRPIGIDLFAGAGGLGGLPDAGRFTALTDTDPVRTGDFGEPSACAAKWRCLAKDAWHCGYVRDWDPAELTLSARTAPMPAWGAMALGGPALLAFDLYAAAKHFGIEPPPSRGDRKSGARKRKQIDIEPERSDLQAVYVQSVPELTREFLDTQGPVMQSSKIELRQ